MSEVKIEIAGESPVHFRDDVWAAVESGLPDETPAVRLAYAAAHVVMRESYAEVDHTPDTPGSPGAIGEHIDWEATMAFRCHLDELGFGVAEAMDTAQRFEIGWSNAERLIRKCGELELKNGFVAGAGVDQRDRIASSRELVDAVVEQCAVIQEAGGMPVILPMPWLSLKQCDAETYVNVYRAIIREAPGPLFLHWLGPMFLPTLEGYFPDDSFERIMAADPGKVRGAKLSMLDPDLECRLRRRMLERDQLLLTGDDLHFASLIAGTEPAGTIARRTSHVAGRRVPLGDFSHALLGAFAAIARPASLALRALSAGDRAGYDSIMSPCETLARHLFSHPTSSYKTGVAFLAFLNGHQASPMLANHQETARSREHLLEAARLAGACGAIHSASTAAAHLEGWLSRDSV